MLIEPECYRVLLVEDHLAVREMLSFVVEGLPRFRVVGVAADAVAARREIERIRPDLVLLDLVLEAGPALELMRESTRLSPKTRVVVFSGLCNAAIVQAALAAGVSGYVDKLAPLADLRAALVAVTQGETHYSPRIAAIIRDLISNHERVQKQRRILSGRELEVLRLLAEGRRSKEIAKALDISIHTVVNHRTNIMKKTGRRSIARLCLYAMELGLVGPPTVRSVA